MPGFGFYEWLVTSLTVVLIVLAVSAIIIKWHYNQYYYWERQQRDSIVADIYTLALIADETVLEQEICALIKRYKEFDKRSCDLLEDVFFHMAGPTNKRTENIRKIAYELDLPQQSITHLKSRSRARISKGCLQAGVYQYHPAVPYMLNLLKRSKAYLQYDILKALARFGEPGIIIAAFTTIHNDLRINERIVCEVITWMPAGQRPALFAGILAVDSDYLRAIFLKNIDLKSAFELQDTIIRLFRTSRHKELRIAVLKVISLTKMNTLIPELISALQEPDWEIRAEAAKALQLIPDQRALQPLIAAASDRKWWVRQHAALALLALPDSDDAVRIIFEHDDSYAIDSLLYAADVTDVVLPES